MLSEDEIDDLFVDKNVMWGRKYERGQIIALLELCDSGYERHSECRLCEAIAFVKAKEIV